MERAREIALAADSPVAATTVNNLAVYATFAAEFPRTAELYDEAMRLAERYGDASAIRFIRGNRIWIDFMLGRWDLALESANAFIAECEAGLRMLAAGRTADAEVELERAVAFYRSVDASACLAQIESALAGAQSASA